MILIRDFKENGDSQREVKVLEVVLLEEKYLVIVGGFVDSDEELDSVMIPKDLVVNDFNLCMDCSYMDYWKKLYEMENNYKQDLYYKFRIKCVLGY